MLYPGRVYAKIDLTAVEHNFDCMRVQLKEETKICAVLKMDGYGHGAVQIAKRIEKRPYIWGFAVAAVEEAMALRENGISKPILILGYVFAQDYTTLVHYDIRPAVFTLKMAQELNRCAAFADRVLPIHIAVDTGITRIGYTVTEESADEIREICSLQNLCPEGIFSHFARADEADKTETARALKAFLSMCAMLEERGVKFPLRHISNSAAVLEYPESQLDMVRAGITIYGIYPSDEVVRDKKLWPVMELKSHIAYIRNVEGGMPISYGGTYVTRGETAVATIPVGYADGYPRSLSNKGYVLIRGQKAPVIGRVCMDQLMVDATGIGARQGDEVTILGRDGDSFIGIDEIAALSGRFPYEFVCNISKRVPRVFI